MKYLANVITCTNNKEGKGMQNVKASVSVSVSSAM